MTRTESQKRRRRAQNGLVIPPRSSSFVAPPRSSSLGNDLNRIKQLEQQLKQLSVKPKGRRAGISNNDIGAFVRGVGNTAGRFVTGIPEIFGSGSYRMNQNVLWNTNGQVPSIHSTNESILLRHKEYVMDVSANVGSGTLEINPGDLASFPWLSQVATSFQEYRFTGLIFEYKSTSAVALVSGTNTAMGTFSMATRYRTDISPASSKKALMEYMWAVDTKVSDNCVLPIECAPRENPLERLYIYNGTYKQIPAGSDPKTYLLGAVDYRVDGTQSGQTNVIGELWVSYEVELFKPVSSFGLGLTSVPLHAATRAGIVSNSTPLGTSKFSFTDADDPAWIVDGPNNNMYLPNVTANYIVYIRWSGGGSAAVASPGYTGSNGATVTYIRTVPQSSPTVFDMVVSLYVSVIGSTANAIAGVFPTINVHTDGTLPTTGLAQIEFDQVLGTNFNDYYGNPYVYLTI